MQTLLLASRRVGLIAVAIAHWAVLTAVHAEPVTLALSGFPQTATAGSEITFQLNALNPASAPVSWLVPVELKGRLVAAQGTFNVVAKRTDSEPASPATIAGGGFVCAGYRLALPGDLSGDMVLEFREPELGRVMLTVQPAEAITPPPSARGPAETVLHWFLRDAEPAEAGTALEPGRFFKEHFFGYDPMYFIAGTESPNAKFQVSFKYRLLNEDGALAKHAPVLTGLHLAYSQTSLWDWNAESRPFYDSSYKPELLYAWEKVVGGDRTTWFRLDLQGGFQHESNGKSGDDSRSLNIAYLRPTLVFGRDDQLQLTLIPRVWAYVGDLDENPDLKDYRGFADLRAVVGWRRGFQVSALGRLGDDGDHGSVQIDATYPMMRILSGSFSIYLHAQYFTGYGESFLGYRERSSVFRAGISLYR